MVEPLTKAGRYEIVRELGRGSMGIVFEGYDPVIGRTVAIKTMLTEGLSAKEFGDFKARFQREARAAGVLSHPNIVNVFDYGEDSGVLFLIMEYLEGRSLEKLLDGQNLLPIETVIPMYDQVCSALDHAHQRGIVHRDVKPANIMILDNGFVKVTDFGIAKMASLGVTQAGQVLGTPTYMSPEQIKGREVDGRSDIFSLGIILYGLVTGEMPFTGQNVTTVIYKIVNENPIPPRELDATIHPGLSYVVCKALAKSPDERYQTCRELADDLRNFKCLGAAPSATLRVNVPILQVADTDDVAPPPVPPRSAPIAPPETAGPAPAVPKVRASPVGWSLVTLLGMVILGTLAGARYLHRHERQPQVIIPLVVQLRVESNIPGARVYVDGRGGPNWVTPYTVSGLPAGSHQLVVSKEGYDNFQQAVTVEAGKTSSITASLPEHPPEAPPPVPAEKTVPAKRVLSTPGDVTREPDSIFGTAGSVANPSPRMGQLWVEANIAGASISIDGKSNPDWVTPCSAPIEVPAGTHEVLISKQGYDDYQQSISIEVGKTRNLSVVLSAPTGEVLFLTIPPGLEVSVDGKVIGPSPAHAVVPAGEHAYTIGRPGSTPYENTVTVKSGGLVTVRVNLRGEAADTGIVTVKTIPPGAAIWADGKRVESQTPASFRLTVGRHRLAIFLAGFRPARRVIEVGADGNVEVDVPLARP